MKKIALLSLLTFLIVGCSHSTIEVYVEDGTTKTITPEWITLDNGAKLAKDPETGIIYARNEVGEYAEYIEQ